MCGFIGEIANPSAAVTLTVVFALIFIGIGFGTLAVRVNRDDAFITPIAFLLGFFLGPIGLYLVSVHNRAAAEETRRELEQVAAEHAAREIADHVAGPYEVPRAPDLPAGPEVIQRDKPPSPEELRSAPAFAPPPPQGLAPQVTRPETLPAIARKELEGGAPGEIKWAASPFKKANP